jgi:sodium-independent sulfate anion transporter 11
LTSLKNLGPLKKVGFLRSRAVDSSLWFIATSRNLGRNAIAVIAGCLAAYFLEQNGSKPFTLTGHFHFQMQLGIFIYKFRHQ